MTVMFELAYKSTLDHFCNQIAQELKNSGDPDLTTLLHDGLDNLVSIDANTKNMAPAILWQSGFIMPSPKDPMYSAKFSVGVKTTNDDANYIQSKVVSKLAQYFPTEGSIDICDYSGDQDNFDPTVVGTIFIQGVVSNPMVFDNQVGLKLLEVTAMLLRHQ